MIRNVSEQLKKPIYALFLGWVFLFSSLTAADNERSNQELKQYISSSMNQLMFMLKENKADYKNDAELFYKDLNIELSKVINFKRIALRVMGKYGRKVPKEERTQFINTFKQSLYKTYAQVLLDSEDVEVKVVNAIMNTRNPKKAKVNMLIKSASGSSYDVSYSLHKGKDKIYRVENIVVMGINLGLAYKDRFHQQVKTNKGNISAVIEQWTFEETNSIVAGA